jgi:hypothetical protein
VLIVFDCDCLCCDEWIDCVDCIDFVVFCDRLCMIVLIVDCD